MVGVNDRERPPTNQEAGDLEESYLVVLGLESRILHRAGKCSITQSPVAALFVL